MDKAESDLPYLPHHYSKAKERGDALSAQIFPREM